MRILGCGVWELLQGSNGTPLPMVQDRPMLPWLAHGSLRSHGCNLRLAGNTLARRLTGHIVGENSFKSGHEEEMAGGIRHMPLTFLLQWTLLFAISMFTG